MWDFSGGQVVKNLSRGPGFDPCSGKIPHALGNYIRAPQLLKPTQPWSPPATTTEAVALEPVLCNERVTPPVQP